MRKKLKYTIIRIYGLDKNNKNICVRVDDFTPYIYIELPIKIRNKNINWTITRAQLVFDKLDELLGTQKPIIKSLTWRKKLYGAHIDINNKRKIFPYLFCSFSNTRDIKTLYYKLKTMNIFGIGRINLKIHESDANPILQLVCCRKISTAGWVKFIGRKIHENNKLTLCDSEYYVKYKHLYPIKKGADVEQIIPKPKIMGFDIEVNSSNPSAMPNAKKSKDKIFQISCVIAREGDSPKDYEKYLLTLGDPDEKTVGYDTIIYTYPTEAELLLGYTKLIREENPNIIVGYNILGFDIPYMIAKAKSTHVFPNFSKQGFHKYTQAKEKIIKWSSSAYRNQEFEFLNAEGRLFVDLLPLVRRDFKFNNYKLKTISTYFLGQTKDPLTPKGIFKCYRIGIKKNKNGEYSKKARRAMAIVGKYCLVDSILVVKLMNILKTWAGLTEMAKTCVVPIFTLYTQGQQIKVYSQIYKYCMGKGIVVEKDAYKTPENERFIGAKVFPPIPGKYKMVVPFDFASLYPTTIIAYNIDYHTWVPDHSSVSDHMCHIMSWEDHCNCILVGTPITIGEFSLNIEDLSDYRGKLLAYDNKNKGMGYFSQKDFFPKGIKECVKLTFEDGSTLECTPNHRILLSDNTWCEAQNIKINSDRVSVSYKPPIFNVKGRELLLNGNYNKFDELYLSYSFYFTGLRMIKFYKILGILCSNGYCSKNRTKIYLGHKIDLNNAIRDIDALEKDSYSVRKINYGWEINILGKLGKMFRDLDDMMFGKKLNQVRTLPKLLENASLGELCAFLSGLYGGHGHTLSYSKKSQALGTVKLSWSSKNKEQLDPVFQKLKMYLKKCGIDSIISNYIHKKNI